MSSSFYANAVIGIEIDIEKVLPDRLVRTCQCQRKVTKDMKFCPSCSKKAWEKEEDPIEGLENYNDEVTRYENVTLFGIPIMCIRGYCPIDRERYKTLQMFAVAVKISHGDVNYDSTPEMTSLPKNISEMTEKLRNALGPYDLWDENKFGLWAIGEIHG